MLEPRRIATILVPGVLGIAAAGVLGHLGACTSLTNDAPFDDAGTFEASNDASSPACASCRVGECTALQATCFDSASCAKIAACAHKPNCDAACQARCLCEDPKGQALYRQAAKCDDAARCTGTCKTQCSGATTCPAVTPAAIACDADGGDAGDAAVVLDAGAVDGGADATVDAAAPLESCSSCVGRCSNDLNKCPLLSECSDYLQCALACGTTACVDACGATRASGKAIATEIARCVGISCAAECGL